MVIPTSQDPRGVSVRYQPCGNHGLVPAYPAPWQTGLVTCLSMKQWELRVQKNGRRMSRGASAHAGLEKQNETSTSPILSLVSLPQVKSRP